MSSILISENCGGNIHSTVSFVNRLNLADYVLTMNSSGYNTVVVFKVPTDEIELFETWLKTGKPNDSTSDPA